MNTLEGCVEFTTLIPLQSALMRERQLALQCRQVGLSYNFFLLTTTDGESVRAMRFRFTQPSIDQLTHLIQLLRADSPSS